MSCIRSNHRLWHWISRIFLLIPALLMSQEFQDKDVVLTAPNPQLANLTGEQYFLDGLILVTGEVQLQKVNEEDGIHLYLGKGDYKRLRDALERFLSRPLTEELIHEIKTVIVNYFHKIERKYVAVLLPVQDISDGIVVIEVVPGVIGEIRFEGQKWFSEKTLARPLTVKSGDPIIESDMMDYMAWLNRNPFRKTQLVLQRGSEKGKTDVDFITQDRFPVRVFTGSDNTGYLTTNQYRLLGGINWGNALKIGDLLSYQYTASPNFTQFQSHVVSYTSYLPWKNVLTLFGCYGIVYPTIPNFTPEGKNIQVSGRYSVPFLPLYGDFIHRLDFGFDWKFITSNLFFVGDAVQSIATNDMINVTQFCSTYGLQKNWLNQVLLFEATLYGSVWKNLLPHQSTSEYNDLREGSHVRYGYLRTSLNHRLQLKNKSIFSSLFRGQLASCTLPTSEQFGLGGGDTVRGYYEQQFVADNALLFNFEFYSPPISLFKSVKNALLFLVFFDYGYGRNYSYVQPSFQAQNLFGIGPGIRYDIVPYLSLKMDYGFQLKGIPQDHRTGRFHFSINLSN